MQRKWALGALAVVVVLAGLSAVVLRGRRKPPPKLNPSAAAVVREDSITLNGPVRPQHVTGVAASISGNIDRFFVEVGEEVFQGQLLARIGSAGLDSAKEAGTQNVEKAQDQVAKAEASVQAARMEVSRAEADAQRARTQMESAQRAYERQTTLNGAGATPQMVYEKARDAYQAAIQEYDIMDKAMRASRDNVQSVSTRVAEARAMLAERQQELQNAENSYSAAEVHAPVEGTVVGRKGAPGEPADEQGDQLFQIATDLYALEVTLEAKPEVTKRIHPGQPATVMILDLQSIGLPGTVKEVKEKEVIVEFGGNVPGVRPGMRADVRLQFE